MRKKHLKKALVLAMSSLLLFTPLSPGLATTVYAGEQLGQNNFDDGVGLPWHTCESEPAKMDFEVVNGKYQITIVNPGGSSRGGEDRWDCQFRHRGLKIVSGHQYRVQYEITASNSGKYYTKIGNLEGDVEVWHNMSTGSWDFENNWDPIWINANQTKRVDLTFTADKTINVAEWAFHLGGSGQYTNGDCFPVGTVITFDNMSLIDLSSNENDYVAEQAHKRYDIIANQVGYFTGLQKNATLLSDSRSAIKYAIYDGDREVYSGKTIPFGYDKDSDDYVHILDFTDFDKPGTYTIRTAEGHESRTITIGANQRYAELVRDSLNYFYQNRSGIEIKSDFITSGSANSLKRAAGHTPDLATIEQSWGYNGSSGTQDVSGGWYDAGDHGKYVVNGGLSLWMLQNQYELSLGYADDLYADGTMDIPENNNGYPDLLDEARYELEWMFRMMVKSGDYADMVYHKVHDEKWTGLAVAPSEDTQKRIIKPPTTAATLNVSACAAQAYRLWKEYDPAFADQCLDVAKRTYEAAKKHPTMYAPLDESVGGGAYGDNHTTDEFFWAECELYLSTGDTSYLDSLKKSEYFASIDTHLSGGEDVNTYGSFDWGNVAALGNLSLSLYKNKLGSDYSKIKNNICNIADAFIKQEADQGYGLPYAQSTISYENNQSGYVWGSNSFVIDNSVIMAYAYYLTGKQAYIDGVIGGVDYLLGRNANDISYVTGYGEYTTIYPHHRWWANLIDKTYPLAPSGVLCGGPNSGLEDPWVKGLGWKTDAIAPQKAYVDHIEAWSVNECTINWNSPLSWIASFLMLSEDQDTFTNVMKASHLSAPSGSNTPSQEEKPTEGANPLPQEPTTATAVPDNRPESDKPDRPANTEENIKPTKADAEDKPQQKPSDSSSEKSGLSEKTIILIVLVVAGIIVLISTEIFIYKILTAKNKKN